jgi:hypothetical protein
MDHLALSNSCSVSRLADGFGECWGYGAMDACSVF